MSNETTKAIDRTIAALKTAFHENTEAFWADARALAKQIIGAKTAQNEAKTNTVGIGLHVGVAADYWLTNQLSAKPEWCGKEFGKDYLPFQLGMKPGETLPPTIRKNGQVVLCLVVPGEGQKQHLTEEQYLVLKQSALNSMWSMLDHYKFKTSAALDDPFFAEAVKACIARQEGYTKVLSGLAENVTGKGKNEKADAVGEMASGVPLYTLQGSADFILGVFKDAGRAEKFTEKAILETSVILMEVMEVIEYQLPGVMEKAVAAYDRPKYLQTARTAYIADVEARAKALAAEKAEAEKAAKLLEIVDNVSNKVADEIAAHVDHVAAAA